jgi:hypothetical protein
VEAVEYVSVGGCSRTTGCSGWIPVVSKNSNGSSSSVPIIVVEHAAETFPSADPAFGQTDLVSGFDDLPAAPLMVPLFVIVDEILVHDMPKVVLSKEHQPVNRLALERTMEPLQIRVAVRRP